MFKYPKSWGDVTVNQFVEIAEIIKKGYDNDDDLYFDIISLICDLPLDELESMDYNEFSLIKKDLKYLTVIPPAFQPKEIVSTPLGLFYVNNKFTTNLTIGEFIDLEHLITDDNYLGNIKLILAILYRKRIEEECELFEPKLEKYDNWVSKRANIFGQLKVSDVFGVISQFLEYRELFYKAYEGYFGGAEHENIEYEKGEGILSRATKDKENQRQVSIKKWGWNLLVYQIASNDPLKMDAAYGLNLTLAMNILSMRKELNLG